jgi:hypothetical protein
VKAPATIPLQQLAKQQNRWEVDERFILAITGVDSTEGGIS